MTMNYINDVVNTRRRDKKVIYWNIRNTKATSISCAGNVLEQKANIHTIKKVPPIITSCLKI